MRLDAARLQPRAAAPSLAAPTAVSLFSGAGGMCLGFSQAGFRILVAVERDGPACITYRENHPGTPLHKGDVRGFLSSSQTRHREAFGLNDVDVVFGGPPCQGFSSIGNRDPSDPRNTLLAEFSRAVSVIRPRMAVLENVPGLLAKRNAPLLAALFSDLAAAGYGNAVATKVQAADHGVPQNRKRVLVIATRDDVRLGGPLREAFEAGMAARKLPRVSVHEAMGDLPAAAAAKGEAVPYPGVALTEYQTLMRAGSDFVTRHDTKEADSGRPDIIRMLPPGGDIRSLPAGTCRAVRDGAWRRLHPNRPSHALLAHAAKDLREYVHYAHDRWVTVREAARLQGFPDRFTFPVAQSQALRQLGNSVPPPLAQAVAEVAADILAGARCSGTGRRSGRRPEGDVAATKGERNKQWRAGAGVVSLEMPQHVAKGLRAARDERGGSVADVLAVALAALRAEEACSCLVLQMAAD